MLFGLLGKIGDKNAIEAASSCIGSTIYQLFRQLYQVAGANEAFFALNAKDHRMGLASVDAKLQEAAFVRALEAQAAGGKEFPDLSGEGLAMAYPGQSQGMTQILSRADNRINTYTKA